MFQEIVITKSEKALTHIATQSYTHVGRSLLHFKIATVYFVLLSLKNI